MKLQNIDIESIFQFRDYVCSLFICGWRENNMLIFFQPCLSKFIIPHMGNPTARNWDRFAGTFGYRLNLGTASFSTLTWEIILSKNSIAENIHSQRKFGDHYCQNRGKTLEGEFLINVLYTLRQVKIFVCVIQFMLMVLRLFIHYFLIWIA